MLDSTELTGADLNRALAAYRDALRRNESTLNRLNVYPVPDADTGTNMVTTMESVVATAEHATSIADVGSAMARGSLMGARGNSGVILSQIVRGLAEELETGDDVSGAALARALERGADLAYAAVGDPVEGTILTVARAAADAARAAQAASAHEVAGAAADAATSTLRGTTDLLPRLKEAGVVDAAGAGLLLFLQILAGRAADLSEFQPNAAVTAAPAPTGPRYEVVLILHSDGADEVKILWTALGESVAVAGERSTWRCHVHTDDVGGAISSARSLGGISEIVVTDLVQQIADAHETRAVAVVEDGFEAFFAPFAAMVTSVDAAPALAGAIDPGAIVVRPSSVDAGAPADVEAVEVAAPPQTLTALLTFDPEGDAAENLVAMREAVERVSWGEVARSGARWDARADGKATEFATPSEAVMAVVEMLITPDAEVVTILSGDGSTEADRAALERAIASLYPFLVTELLDSGAPGRPYVIGVE